MNLTYYYDDLKRLARQVRRENGLTSERVLPGDLRRIYARNGIEIDVWPYRFRNLRGAFLCDEIGTTVMLAKNLPRDPLAFTMAHELKHFLRDRNRELSYCDESNVTRPVEIGAEVFAAELLFPDAAFAKHMERLGIKRGECSPETLVKLKHETETTLSYAGLAIKAERLWFAPPKTLTRVRSWRTYEKLSGLRK